MSNPAQKILVIDHLPPQDLAMLQALYSRSDSSVTAHLDKVKETGSSKFMEQYYVGYSHKSIGDCGSTTVFIENVSILADKAVQDHPLYSGQECSTRYIDFRNRPMVNPFPSNPVAQELLDNWLELYYMVYDKVSAKLRSEYAPLDASSAASNRQFDNAVHARACDVARGFLPTAVTTNLSWHTNLRQASDKLHLLKHHDLPEVRKVAFHTLDALQKQYPSSFTVGLSSEKEQYLFSSASQAQYPRNVAWSLHHEHTADFISFSDDPECELLMHPTADRPYGMELPRILNSIGQFRFKLDIDYGAWRDLQRHRGASVPAVPLQGPLVIHSWYLQQLPEEFVEVMNGFLIAQQHLLTELEKMEGDAKFLFQYFYPLGQLVPTTVVCGLAEAVYIVEARTSKHVHTTLRQAAHEMAEHILTHFPSLTLHLDNTPWDEFNFKRGDQTITEKAQ